MFCLLPPSLKRGNPPRMSSSPRLTLIGRSVKVLMVFGGTHKPITVYNLGSWNLEKNKNCWDINIII